MKLFDILPSDLFSVLASPNRVLYSDALDVLYNAYRETLKIPEEKLYTMLRSKLEQQLAEKKVEVTFTDKLRKHLAAKGFDPAMGARPMQRLIQDTIRRSLADELLFGRLVEGGRLEVDWNPDANEGKGDVVLDITPLPEAASEPEHTATSD